MRQLPNKKAIPLVIHRFQLVPTDHENTATATSQMRNVGRQSTARPAAPPASATCKGARLFVMRVIAYSATKAKAYSKKTVLSVSPLYYFKWSQ